jgi:geranylgeranyl transferase type-2 subunit beta
MSEEVVKIQTVEGGNESSVVFHREAHLQYIGGLADKLDKKSSYEGAVTDHLRMSGIYWT